jgi:hypothetical protein
MPDYIREVLFIFQQALRGQVMAMRVRDYAKIGLLAAMLGTAATPAVANNKEKQKRTEPAAVQPENCKPAVRPMSESTPARKNECVRTRRILM